MTLSLGHVVTLVPVAILTLKMDRHSFAGMSSTEYAAAQNVSAVTMDLFEKAQTETPGMNYGMVQSAATSSEFVSRCLVRQKKKFSSK